LPEILRLHPPEGLPIKQIERVPRISRGMVRAVLRSPGPPEHGQSVGCR
jgi:hypothetical protein